MGLILYQRDDCQLCDLALAELAQARVPAFESVFLEDVPTLEARYGKRVPVLRDEVRDRELDWPFAADDVQAFLAADAANVVTDAMPRPASGKVA